MSKISRLVKRKENGIYYCRAAVPKDLIQFIGKREVKISLGTADYPLKSLVLAVMMIWSVTVQTAIVGAMAITDNSLTASYR